jgi:hypothetical protein
MFAEIVLKLDLSEISLLDPAGDLEHGSLQKDAVWSNIVTCRWCHFSLDSLTLVNLFTTSRHAFGVLMKRERVALRSMINDLAHFAYTTHGIEPTDTIGAISDLGRRFLIENNHRDFLLHKVPEVVTYKNALTSLLSASEWDNPDLEDALCESELLLVLGRLNLEWFSEIVRDRSLEHPSIQRLVIPMGLLDLCAWPSTRGEDCDEIPISKHTCSDCSQEIDLLYRSIYSTGPSSTLDLRCEQLRFNTRLSVMRLLMEKNESRGTTEHFMTLIVKHFDRFTFDYILRHSKKPVFINERIVRAAYCNVSYGELGSFRTRYKKMSAERIGNEAHPGYQKLCQVILNQWLFLLAYVEWKTPTIDSSITDAYLDFQRNFLDWAERYPVSICGDMPFHGQPLEGERWLRWGCEDF